MRYCDFVRTGFWIECRWKCGTKLQLPVDIDERAILSPCNDAPDFTQCAHIGEPIGEPVKVACRSCNPLHQAFSCDAVPTGKALPTFRGPWGDAQKGAEDQWYTLCNQCALFVHRNTLVQIAKNYHGQ